MRNFLSLTMLGGSTGVLQVIRDLLVFGGLGDLAKFCEPVWGPKEAKNTQQWIFPVLGSALGETPHDQIWSHAKCGPSEPRLGSHVALEPEIWPFWGGWGPFRRSGTSSVC